MATTVLQTKLVFLYTFISEEAPQFGQYETHVFCICFIFCSLSYFVRIVLVFAPQNTAFCRKSNYRFWCDSLKNNSLFLSGMIEVFYYIHNTIDCIVLASITQLARWVKTDVLMSSALLSWSCVALAVCEHLEMSSQIISPQLKYPAFFVRSINQIVK